MRSVLMQREDHTIKIVETPLAIAIRDIYDNTSVAVARTHASFFETANRYMNLGYKPLAYSGVTLGNL